MAIRITGSPDWPTGRTSNRRPRAERKGKAARGRPDTAPNTALDTAPDSAAPSPPPGVGAAAHPMIIRRGPCHTCGQPIVDLADCVCGHPALVHLTRSDGTWGACDTGAGVPGHTCPDGCRRYQPAIEGHPS